MIRSPRWTFSAAAAAVLISCGLPEGEDFGRVPSSMRRTD